MTNTIQILKQTELLGQQFAVYGTAEAPLFLAKDVAEMIEHSDVSKMTKSVEEEEKLIGTMFVSGQNRQMWFLTEDGLYEVLMQSRKPIAKAFKKGVKTILKEIRTSGGYIATSEADTPELIMARALQVAQKTIEDSKRQLQMVEGERDHYKQEVKELEPMAEYTREVLQSETTYTFTQMANDLGFRSVHVFTKLLKDNGIIYKQSGQWLLYAKFRGNSYTTTRTSRYFHKDGTPDTSISTVWTEKGRAWLHSIIKFNEQTA